MNTCSYICIKFIIMNERPDTTKMEEAAYTLKAISNGTRLCVISILSEQDELNVSQLVEQLNCEQSLLSHHLTDMRAKGILYCRRDGKNCYYSLKNKQIVQIIDCICSCNCLDE
jgi:DNA-binding transcriptional ArsR family regulator